ncbi:unnamed protein product [Vitrella brassicaformis CCMP3155]|uniref:F-box domain-containing protein n=1 Tax=Vitrella brassicaformis (strain CCMP3155) TaxID=1169540 RepID=A0A0G4GBX0_VITBC|nr:unnamed protein product [Vitrella brassicaformis CCMP3155]|eukprot:CEM26337.1 unnamed protein product [Vitrella brassicaformis CCMP3155]
MLWQVDIRRFLRPAAASDKADQEPQQQHNEQQPTDFSSPEAQAIANEIVRQRDLAAPPPNASLCGVPPEKLAHVCDHMPTLEAVRLALINKTLQDTCRSPFVIRHLFITPATHQMWRRASRAVLRQLRCRLTHLQTAAITTDEEVYSRGPGQDRPGDDTASDDGREGDDEPPQVVGGNDEATEARRRALGHRAVYAKVLEGSAASLKKCRLEDKTTTVPISPSNLPVTANPRPPMVTFGKLEEVVLYGTLWQGAAYDRRWSLPALKTLVVSFPIAPQYFRSWVKASPHLSHLHVTPFPLPHLTSSLSAAPSLAGLTSLGCIDLTATDASSWQPLLSVLESKGAVGRNGRIHTLGVCIDVEDMEPNGILTSLRALATAIHRLAGVGISAAVPHVTVIPDVSVIPGAPRAWDDHIMANVINHPRQVDSVAARPSSSAAAACEPSVGGERRAPLFPNMVPTDDHDGASGEMVDKRPTQRPFQLLVKTSPLFDDRLLRLGLTASDALPRKIIREMARMARSMVVKAVSIAAPATGSGSFGDYVFESLDNLTICGSPAITNCVLPSLPAAPRSRFPRLETVCFKSPSIRLIRQGGVRELLMPVRGQLTRTRIELRNTPSSYDTSYGSDDDPPPPEAAPDLLAQLILECLKTTGHVDKVILRFRTIHMLADIAEFRPQTSPINHLFTTPNLAGGLPPIRELFIETPCCVHDRFGDVQTDFIMAVIRNTPGLKKVEFSDHMTQALVRNLTPHLLRHSPAYLATAAVDEALASAGSPFVVVFSDDTTLCLK